MNDDSAEFLRTQIKNLWFYVSILPQYLPEIILVGITDYNILFCCFQKRIKPFRVMLEIELTALIKYEIILAGIAAIIWNHKIRPVMVTDSVYQPVFRICDIRTCFLLSKALIAASSARMDLLLGKSKYSTVLFITRLDQCADAVTVSVCSRAEGYNHNSHIYSHQEVVLCNDIQIAQ